jgi:hypothetical protein
MNEAELKQALTEEYRKLSEEKVKIELRQAEIWNKLWELDLKAETKQEERLSVFAI